MPALVLNGKCFAEPHIIIHFKLTVLIRPNRLALFLGGVSLMSTSRSGQRAVLSTFSSQGIAGMRACRIPSYIAATYLALNPTFGLYWTSLKEKETTVPMCSGIWHRISTGGFS